VSAAPQRRQPAAGQRGVSGVLVILVLVLLASLSTYAVGLITSVHSGFATEVNHARATRAAEAGLDWARFRIVQQGAACVAAPQSVALPGPLAAYTVSITCTAGGTDGGATPPSGPTLYQLSAVACNRPQAGQCPNTAAPAAQYVERRLSAIVAR
jgi:MSHA biogenesis protein MshP